MTPDTVDPNPNLNPDADPTRPAPPDLRAVKRNLQRERRVFSMVVLLLGLLVIAIASTAVLVRFNGSLRAQEQMTRLYEQGVVDAVLERRSSWPRAT
jgi:two-component system capsular synthesis sensor histidine kinase RcsC